MVGQTISHYRVESKLGEGGMGVVYKAEDTRLGRTVALKFLAPHLVADETQRKRFEREAKAVAALDHPNICTVFDIGDAEGNVFLAMAYAEGRTVKDMVAERPLKLDDALDVATQTAEGLRAAHEKGIVHRDIKSANVMVGPQRQVKIMDFGLAQLNDGTQLTQAAAVVGTPAYMSPEQAQGKPTDHRTDIWSFGVMLYEMVTGLLPFAGERSEAIFHAIGHEEPEPVTALRSGVPMELEWIIGKCLAKDPAGRYQHMDDLIVDLSTLRKKLDSGLRTSRVAPPPRRIPARKVALFAAAAAVLVFLAARFIQQPREAPPPGQTVKFTITPPKLGRGGDNEIDAEVSISRDGNHITYVDADGQLWIRDLNKVEARPVPGATNVYQVFWSPDNQFIGYAANRDLVKVPVEGGSPQLITRLAGFFKRASFSSDGETIVYCDATGLYTVPAQGGQPTLHIQHDHIEHPSFLDLPDGRRAFLYQAVDEGPGTLPGHVIYAQVVGEEERRVVIESKSNNPYPCYSPTGHIVYVEGNGDAVSIWALPYSLSKLEPTGAPFPIAQRVASPMVSDTGTLVYSDVPSNRVLLAWCDRSGEVLSTIGEPQGQLLPRLSPDGRKLAVVVMDAEPDIWIHDLERAIQTRFTLDPAQELLGAWAPSGDEIAYASNGGGNFDIFSKPVGGAATLLAGAPQQEFAPSWSPDGRFLMYETSSRESVRDLLYRERRADGTMGEPAVFLQTRFEERGARFSPDGRLVVYVSNESGRYEIYVRDFPPGARKWLVSTDGGIAPLWRRDGREIFYVQRNTLMAVPVATQPAFSAGAPVALFQKPTLGRGDYDVSADGQRFLIRERPADPPPLSIHIAHNWFEEFRGRELGQTKRPIP